MQKCLHCYRLVKKREVYILKHKLELYHFLFNTLTSFHQGNARVVVPLYFNSHCKKVKNTNTHIHSSTHTELTWNLYVPTQPPSLPPLTPTVAVAVESDFRIQQQAWWRQPRRLLLRIDEIYIFSTARPLPPETETARLDLRRHTREHTVHCVNAHAGTSMQTKVKLFSHAHIIYL